MTENATQKHRRYETTTTTTTPPAEATKTPLAGLTTREKLSDFLDDVNAPVFSVIIIHMATNVCRASRDVDSKKNVFFLSVLVWLVLSVVGPLLPPLSECSSNSVTLPVHQKTGRREKKKRNGNHDEISFICPGSGRNDGWVHGWMDGFVGSRFIFFLFLLCLALFVCLVRWMDGRLDGCRLD